MDVNSQGITYGQAQPTKAGERPVSLERELLGRVATTPEPAQTPSRGVTTCPFAGARPFSAMDGPQAAEEQPALTFLCDDLPDRTIPSLPSVIAVEKTKGSRVIGS